jgi:hypothetical protein
MFFKEIITDYSEKHTKNINSEQNPGLLNVKARGTYSNHWALGQQKNQHRWNWIWNEHPLWKEAMQEWLKIQSSTFYFDGLRELVDHWTKSSECCWSFKFYCQRIHNFLLKSSSSSCQYILKTPFPYLSACHCRFSSMLKMIDVSEVLTVSIIRVLMIEAVSTSETSASFYQTTRLNIPEHINLHTCRRENLKSHSSM